MTKQIKCMLLRITLISTVPQAAIADDCKLLLCLGAPDPLSISECAGVVKDYFRAFFKPRLSCPAASAAGWTANAKETKFGDCPNNLHGAYSPRLAPMGRAACVADGTDDEIKNPTYTTEYYNPTKKEFWLFGDGGLYEYHVFY